MFVCRSRRNSLKITALVPFSTATPVFVNNTYSRTIALMRGIEFNFPVVAMSGSIFFLVLVLCQPYRSFAQTVSPATPSQRTSTVAPNKDAASNLGVTKPAVAPRSGTWNYRTQAGIGEQPKLNSAGTSSTTVKDDGGAWTVTVAMEFPEGPVTDALRLDKGTLILRKESFKHFVHPDQRWKAVATVWILAATKSPAFLPMQM